ncbi:DUF927 domain-containing protein [Xenorhabdus sp. XENO-10]|uniref:DUF927 domain-containing protein n=1 Tax=Xenorhabdus yunnanensis TaxID=3025878 RepID=A0ABT5LFG2_9GAMM|nr:DUF927 domain-containing protein [Xenorhabdus yunnanensis]MDC9589804.1 DUF927 domain-containing protein [Xenorhabdus yunnanensis]
MDFLTSVVPPEGETVLVTIKKNPRMATGKEVRNYWINIRNGNVARFIQQHESGETDLYFAMSSFNTKGTEYAGRRDDHVQEVKSLWLDIDAGKEKYEKHPKWAYPSFEMAHAAFSQWLVDADMWQPNYVIASGEGLHIYWILDKPVSPEQWRILHGGLEQLVHTHGLKMDAGASMRISGILRVPGTRHTKSGNAVRIIATESTPYSLAEMQEVLPYVQPQSNSLGAMPDFLQDENDFQDAVWGVQKKSFSFAQIIARCDIGSTNPKPGGCDQLALCYEQQSTTDEPTWRGALSIAINCFDGEEWIHKISDQYPTYSVTETEFKAQSVIDKPYTCDMFSRLNPDVCRDCPHWGKIRSPIVLGKVIEEASEEELKSIINHIPQARQVTIQDGQLPSITLLSKQVAEITEQPLPFHRDYKIASNAMGSGIWKRAKEADGKEILIYKYPLLFLNRVYSPQNGESFVMQVTMPHDPARVFELPVSELPKDQSLQGLLSKHGVTVTSKGQWGNLMTFLRRTAEQAADVRAADKQHQHYGWTEDMSAFLLGNTEFRVDGSVRPMILANNGGSMDKAFRMSEDASVAGFRKAMDLINVPDMELTQFLMGVSFSAPLFKLMGVQGCLVHSYATKSGVGKTTSARLAVSIWGRHQVDGGSGIEGLTRDTAVALYRRLGELNAITMFIDEITERQGKELTDFVYSVTQGRDKDRGLPNTNRLQENNGSWTMAVLSTGNLSLTQQLVNMNALSEALNARVIELDMSNLPSLWGRNNENKDFVEQTFMLARTIHSGATGRLWLRNLMRNIALVKKLCEDVSRECQEFFDFTQKERYWTWTVSLGIAGLIIGKELGAWDFDVARVMTAVKEQLERIRVNIEQDKITPTSIFEHFISATFENRLEIRSANTPIMSNQLPSKELGLRQENYSHKLFINKGFARRWCESNNYPFDLFKEHMKLLRARDTRKHMLEGVTSIPVKSKRPNVWELDLRGETND